MKVELSPKQITTIAGMNKYWEEVAERENQDNIPMVELNGLLRIIPPIDILLILGEYAKNYKAD